MRLIVNDENDFSGGKWFNLPEHPDYGFKIKPLTQADLRKLRDGYTSITFDKKSHQKIEVEDPEKKRQHMEDMIIDTVVDWRGVEEKGTDGELKPAKFSRDEFKKMLDKFANWKLYVEYNEEEGENEWVTFAGWFMKVALDPSMFVNPEEDLGIT